MNRTSPSRKRLRALSILASAALASVVITGVVTPDTRTGAWFTADKSLSGNQLTAATLGAPANLAITTNSSGGNVVSWSSAASQTWAQANNVSSGITYTVQRTLPNQTATTMYTGSAQSYTDASSSPSATQFTQVSAGQNHSLALAQDGTVWAWGTGDVGQLGTGGTSDAALPVSVPLRAKATQVEAAWAYSLALLEDGSVWAWGQNNHGQLGDGSTRDRYSPVRVVFPEGVTVGKLADLNNAVYTSFAITPTGTIYAWGLNQQYQLGLNDTTDRVYPTAIPDVTVTAVSAGVNHAAALSTGGDILTWGDGSSKQLGRNNSVRTRPRVVSFGGQVGANGFKQVSSGYFFVIAQDYDGRIWTWGTMSDNVSPERTDPEVITSGGFDFIEAGRTSACAKKISSEMLCWGSNKSGLLMDGTTTSSANPVSATSATSKNLTSLSISNSLALGTTQPSQGSGTNIWTWGTGPRGNGDGGAATAASQVRGPGDCPSGLTLRSGYCTPPSGTQYSVTYTYAGWKSGVARATTNY
ncbi:alpha-tubulin suppressor-like RCC1 family protein [Microbacterium sp. SORGH_AS 421]|nr:alpha-tubulin suppressor-like RCC1 family protein [Microbacterium sp. SORGH_AS_0421]